MAKNYKQVKRKIKKLASNEEASTDDLVIHKGNEFLVYNAYRIVKNKHMYEIYEIDANTYVNTVYNSSTAISWCNAHKANDMRLASNIILADRAIESITNDIAYTNILLNRTNTIEARESILLARLIEYTNKQWQLKLNLHKYIQRSKQIKSKGFLNEFTTTSNTNKLKRVR